MVDRRASELGLPSGLSRDDALSTIDQHIPSLSDEDERWITTRVFAIVQESITFTEPGKETDVADLALRTCMCGKKIDGFYEFVDHLKEVLS